MGLQVFVGVFGARFDSKILLNYTTSVLCAEIEFMYEHLRLRREKVLTFGLGEVEIIMLRTLTRY